MGTAPPDVELQRLSTRRVASLQTSIDAHATSEFVDVPCQLLYVVDVKLSKKVK